MTLVQGTSLIVFLTMRIAFDLYANCMRMPLSTVKVCVKQFLMRRVEQGAYNFIYSKNNKTLLAKIYLLPNVL